jgi:hypothetical protein
MGDSSATRAHHPQIQQPIFAAVSGADQEPAAPFDGAVSSRVQGGCKEENATILSTTRVMQMRLTGGFYKPKIPASG